MYSRVGKVKKLVREQLSRAGVPDASFDTRILLETVLHCRYPDDYDHLTRDQLARLENLMNRRCTGEPLQYLIGSWNFYGIDLFVGEGVLIPRPDTETLIDAVLSRRADASSTRLMDLCSGTGCIAIVLAVRLKNTTGACMEYSKEALEYLRKNLDAHHVALQAIEDDACASAVSEKEKFDVITCNPPYLSADDMSHLQREVTFEPKMALDGGEDGLSFYRTLIPKWKHALAPGAMLVFEVGAGQAEEVERMMREAGLENVERVKDLAKIDRVVIGYNGKYFIEQSIIADNSE